MRQMMFDVFFLEVMALFEQEEKEFEALGLKSAMKVSSICSKVLRPYRLSEVSWHYD